MDEGRDRGRAFHGIGQPHIERQLRRLSGGPDQEQQRDRGGGGPHRLEQDLPAFENTVSKPSDPKVAKISISAMRKPKSPIRLTMNAFFPAAAADGFSNQNEISR